MSTCVLFLHEVDFRKISTTTFAQIINTMLYMKKRGLQTRRLPPTSI